MRREGVDSGDEMFILEYEDRNISLREGEREMAFGGERGGPLNHISLMEEDSGGHMCLLMCACLRERERERERFGHMDEVFFISYNVGF